MNTLFRKNEEFNPAESGLAFSFAVLLPYLAMLVATLIFGAAGGDGESALFRYIAAFVSQLSYLAVIFFLWRRKGGFKPFRAGKFSAKYLAAGLLLCYGMLFGLGYLNQLFIELLQRAGLAYNPVSVPLDGPGQLVLSLIAMVLLPAFCEEMLFRGAILRGTAYMKTWQAVLLNGAVFALFHQNPAQTIYPFLTGAVFAFVALRSGSALSCVFMHAVNNAAVLLLGYFAPQAELFTPAVVSTALACFVLALAYLLFFDKGAEKKTDLAEGVPLSGKYFFIFAAAGGVMCVVSWIVALVG